MKKMNLKLGGIKEMLTREQMKKVVGGYGYDGGGSTNCYMCCSPDPQGPCGVCNKNGNGGCLGAGIATSCSC